MEIERTKERKEERTLIIKSSGQRKVWTWATGTGRHYSPPF